MRKYGGRLGEVLGAGVIIIIAVIILNVSGAAFTVIARNTRKCDKGNW